MKTQRSELLLLGVLGILLIVASLLSVQNQQNNETDWLNGSSYSSGQKGGRAFYLWLGELGYYTQRLQPSNFTLQEVEGVLWIISPSRQPLTETDAKEISKWVRNGGILVWADSFPTGVLLDELEIGWHNTFSTFQPVTPWFRHPNAKYQGWASFSPSPDVVPLLADSDGKLGALHTEFGAGELWLFAIDDPFTNNALYDEKNSALVMGLLEQLPPNRTMIFDEFHHGFGDMGADWSLLRTMTRTSWGWGIYYAAIVLGVWIVLQGRAFGRPLPLPGEHLRREAGEYVRSMAWLYRRARVRASILRHHHQRLKQRVTKRYRLPATSEDAAFLDALSRYRTDIDYPALRDHLLALRKRQPSEQEVLALARANDEWLEQLL